MEKTKEYLKKHIPEELIECYYKEFLNYQSKYSELL